VVTTGVEGCNKPAIAEFWSKFNADREPLDEGTGLLPTVAAERMLVELASGENGVDVIGAAPVEMTPAREGIDFVMDARAGESVLLVVSVAVCKICPGSGPGMV
jgi:hypothetical protein